MKARWYRTVVLLGLAVAVLSAVVWWRSREPAYQGKPLNYWVEQFRTRPEAHDECENAIRAIGPKAIPFLMSQARRQDAAYQRLYRFAWPKLPAMVQRRFPPPKPINYTIHKQIGATLGLIGPPALPWLVAGLSDRSSGVRLAAVVAIHRIHPRPAEATVPLAKLLKDPNSWIRLFAVVVISEMTPTTKIHPDLIRALKDSDLPPPSPVPSPSFVIHKIPVRKYAATALGRIGAEASAAIPELSKLLSDPDMFVACEAAMVLWRISGDTNGMSVMIGVLPNIGEPITCCRILTVLGEMGPQARAAAPTITALMTRPNGRLFLSDFSQCARDALLKIDPEAAAKLEREAK